MISQQLVEILACPEDKTPVHLAEATLLEELNVKIRGGELKTRQGELVLDLLEVPEVREEDGVGLRDEQPRAVSREPAQIADVRLAGDEQ